MNQPIQNVVQTITANCQDCYRCVRACPVKAIKIADGQAHIEDELCIHCGTCVKNCPQQAKITVSELDTVRKMLADGGPVAVSVAPAFAALFGGWHSSRLPAALRLLGFTHVSETAEGALQVSEKTLQKKQHASICTACPAVVYLIEKYHPEYLDSLIPVTSPMVLHGRMLKKRYGQDCRVVFIGPCAAKKQEAKRPENRDAIDAVLTFGELLQWLEEENIKLANCSESGFESYGDLSSARLFPIQGGMLKTCGISGDNTQTDILHISGAEQVKEMLTLPPEQWDYQIIEALFCIDGCINGPCYPADTGDSVLARKNRVIDYAKKAPVHPDPLDYEDVNSSGSFSDAEAVYLA
ncbi:MAG: 4Fe-4S binding protein, partial [Clostridia bacterium]|nr:4Fe-4S binding protein [Clostridia bacterium]